VSVEIPDVLEEGIRQLVQRGFSEKKARKALKLNDNNVEAVLDNLMRTGKLMGKRKKKKKKKKKVTEEKKEEEGEEVVDMEWLAQQIKCSRCKKLVTLDEVELHECDEGTVVMLRVVAKERQKE
jgi:hypothetical protein